MSERVAKCRVETCGAALVSGVNCDPSRLKKHDYVCRPCMKMLVQQAAERKKHLGLFGGPVVVTSPPTPVAQVTAPRRRQKVITDSLSASIAAMKNERTLISERLAPTEEARQKNLDAIEQRRQQAEQIARLAREKVEEAYHSTVNELHDRIATLDRGIAMFEAEAKRPSFTNIQDVVEKYLRNVDYDPDTTTPRFLADHVANLIGVASGLALSERIVGALRAAPHRFYYNDVNKTFSLREHHEVISHGTEVYA